MSLHKSNFLKLKLVIIFTCFQGILHHRGKMQRLFIRKLKQIFENPKGTLLLHAILAKVKLRHIPVVLYQIGY